MSIISKFFLLCCNSNSRKLHKSDCVEIFYLFTIAIKLANTFNKRRTKRVIMCVKSRLLKTAMVHIQAHAIAKKLFASNVVTFKTYDCLWPISPECCFIGRQRK